VSLRKQNWLLSGGIGSGKSTVRRIFEKYGVNTVDADSLGHEVIGPGGTAVADVSARWPETFHGGSIDRTRLGEIVFADPDELRALERLTHPHIFALIEERVSGFQGPVIVEIPLLVQPFENSWQRMVVDADDETRLIRAVSRGQAESDVRNRMVSQPKRVEWLAAADLVIPNHGSVHEIEESVAFLARHLFAVQGA